MSVCGKEAMVEWIKTLLLHKDEAQVTLSRTGVALHAWSSGAERWREGDPEPHWPAS